VERVAMAALHQFKGVDVRLHRIGQIRNEADVVRALEEVQREPGIIFYTLVNSELSHFVRIETENRHLQAIDFITPLLYKLAEFLEMSPQEVPGLMYTMNSEYYRRMEAVDFTVKQDDGQEPRNLYKADIVLVGVSRSSKTPLSMYLAHKGYKVANVPLVPGIEPPKELEEVAPERVVGLLIQTQRLVDIRGSRLRNLGQSPRGSYADYSQVEEELTYCRRFYRAHPAWLVIDVTNKSVEESAAEILTRLHGDVKHL
jgi:regulator of PEP synthase PpsR (kinase-PPPase family)